MQAGKHSSRHSSRQAGRVKTDHNWFCHNNNSFEVLAETFSLSLTHPVMFKKFGQRMQAGKQAGRQADMQANMQASRQASRQACRQACRQAGMKAGRCDFI